MNPRYAAGLGRMLACATVSHQPYDDAEFAKLRAAVQALFPLFSAKAERRIFSDDCWVYRLPGRNADRAIMLMNHHDVAEVSNPAEWAHPPFGGEVFEEAVWGRGAVDTKGPLYAALQAIEELLCEGWQPPCDLYLASSHNEECAGDGIPTAVRWFTEQGILLDWVLDEGGAIIDAPLPGISQKCAMIAVHEKGRCLVTCRADEAAFHGGLSPKADTPVTRMARFIADISGKPPFRTRLYPEVAAMFTALAPHMRFPLRTVFSHLRIFGAPLVRLMPKLNPQAGAMVGTSCAFTAIEGSSTAHACTANAFLRCVRADDLTADLEAFRAVAAKYGVTAEVAENDFHTPADLHSPALAYLRACVAEVFPDVLSAPYLLPAGTDARHFSEICSSVLRFAPIVLTPQQFASVHGKNENLSVQALSDAITFYKRLLKGWQLR
ncbi:MAG: M20/M25/M40 family metallo-hydrolase [Clostridia bacterium]